MNIQKIFNALIEDDMNSSLGIIVDTLEKQQYSVLINNSRVSSGKIFDGVYSQLEKLSELNISLKKNNKIEQRFNIEFIEYHKIIFKPYSIIKKIKLKYISSKT